MIGEERISSALYAARAAGKREAVALVRGWIEAQRRIVDYSEYATAREAQRLNLEEFLDGIATELSELLALAGRVP